MFITNDEVSDGCLTTIANGAANNRLSPSESRARKTSESVRRNEPGAANGLLRGRLKSVARPDCCGHFVPVTSHLRCHLRLWLPWVVERRSRIESGARSHADTISQASTGTKRKQPGGSRESLFWVSRIRVDIAFGRRCCDEALANGRQNVHGSILLSQGSASPHVSSDWTKKGDGTASKSLTIDWTISIASNRLRLDDLPQSVVRMPHNHVKDRVLKSVSYMCPLCISLRQRAIENVGPPAGTKTCKGRAPGRSLPDTGNMSMI